MAKFISSEVDTGIRFGLGIAPVQIMKSSVGTGFSMFQVHWLKKWVDWEIFNASYGTTFSGNPSSNVNAFTFRTAPKFRITEGLSIGPILGFQFVSFPNVYSKITNNNFFTPQFEPFSSNGLIYGGVISQLIPIAKTYHLRINENFYWQTYSTVQASDGWSHYFQDNSLNSDSSPLSPGPVILLELSIMY